jgi:hypothetical protein
MADAFTVTPARRGLDALLARYPMLDLVKADARANDDRFRASDPWLIVTLGQRSEGMAEVYARHEFAIWKNTGAVYIVDHHGAVGEDPIIEGNQ